MSVWSWLVARTSTTSTETYTNYPDVRVNKTSHANRAARRKAQRASRKRGR